jgi:hypothetical protein
MVCLSVRLAGELQRRTADLARVGIPSLYLRCQECVAKSDTTHDGPRARNLNTCLAGQTRNQFQFRMFKVESVLSGAMELNKTHVTQPLKSLPHFFAHMPIVREPASENELTSVELPQRELAGLGEVRQLQNLLSDSLFPGPL